MRYISHQINGIAECNIFRLPRAIIEKAILCEILYTNDIIFSDFADICILWPAQQWWFQKLFCKQYKSMLFDVQFSPSKRISWSAMEQFFTFLFHPSSYTKEVEIHSVNQKFVDAVKNKIAYSFCIPGNTIHNQKLKTNKPFYIHCEIFSLFFKSSMNVDGLCNTLTWLERNVRANSIRMPFVSIYTHSQNSQDRDAIYHILNNFVFGALRICAKRELRIHLVTEINFLISLVKKFWTLLRIQCEIPTIVIESFSLRGFKKIQPNLGPNVIHQEVDSHGAEFLYVFENGHNRMRISFCKRSGDYRLTYDWDEYDCYVKFYAT